MSTQEKDNPKGKLIIIGGREAKEQKEKVSEENDQKIDFDNGILNEILLETEKQNPVIEIIPVASNDQEETGQDYINAFAKLKQNVNVMIITNKDDADSAQNLRRLAGTDIVFFTGGNQVKIQEILSETKFLEILKNKYENEDFIIAGTSAGAMVMSENMITEGMNDEAVLKGIIKSKEGLGLISNVIIDTHFLSRGRFSRLAESLLINSDDIGVGICEDTGIIVTQGRFIRTIGSGTVVLMEAKNIKNTNYGSIKEKEPVFIENINVHVLSNGAGFDLYKRNFMVFDKKQVKHKEKVQA